MPMSSVNRVVLVGNLTRDPELRPLPKSEHKVCHLRVACNTRRRISDNEWVDRAHYFDVSVFGPQAESSNRYLRKGKPVAVDGRLEFREWEDGDKKRQAVSIVADTVQFLGTPDPRPRGQEGDANGAAPGLGAQTNEAAPEAASESNGTGGVPVPVGAPGDGEDGGMEDDEPNDLTF